MNNKISKENRLSWFQSGKSIEFVTKFLESSNETIRIATGFFTIKGWNLVRRYTKGKQTYLLVGLDEPGEKRARIALINEIMKDLRTGLDKDRRKSVKDLVKKIQSNQFEIVDARAKDHHNKLYICDDNTAIQTSSNLTGKGLKEQVEGGNIIIDKNEVLALIEEFDNYFLSAQDLTKDLLEMLLKWLEFDTPWDIYLKTMLVLENIQPSKTRYSKKPVSYQIDMIAQTLRQIKKFDGSMLVASTGLGKTVVAVHVALHLKENNLIDNVMIIGPKAVRSNWQKEMREAGLPRDYFVRQTFDKKDAKQDHALGLFEDIIQNIANQRWLLIIDESQEFRNRYKKDLFNMTKKPKERLAFIRLREFIKKGDLKVLLLTGSPYAKDIENINNQLYLLPHTRESKPHELDYFLENLPEYNHLFTEEKKDINAWFIKNIDEFINLSVASQLTTPHVAKYYGQKEESEIYINFGEEKRYVPNVILYSISFPLIFQDKLTEAIVKGYFNLDSKNPMFKDLFNRLVKIAWASSPLSLQGVLESIADTPNGENSYQLGKLKFMVSREDREDFLKPIIIKLKQLNQNLDLKIQVLFNIVKEQVLENQQKVIIFCERRATVVYLSEHLKKNFSALKIAFTIQQNEDEQKYEMKDSKEIEQLIKHFAPYSNQASEQDSENFDVFISTDAHGVGVNMQDASVVINYDIDWTPIGPVQRAGRILRFWHSPRIVHIYTFVPILTEKNSNTTLNYDLVEIQKRWKNLMSRHQESKKVIDLPVLTVAEIQEINIPEVAPQVTIESGEIDLDALADLDISPYYQHTAKLQLNRDYARNLPDDLISAKLFSGKEPLIYMLLFYNNNYYGIFYNPKLNQLIEPDVVKLLNRIACEKDTPTAHVDYDFIEDLTDKCLESWCRQNQASPDDVQRICSLYLKPEHEEDDLKLLLDSVNNP
jgi:superfamily II DNA or RNA helicase